MKLMKFRKLSAVILVMVFLTVFVAGCGGTDKDKDAQKAPDQEKFKVGFVYIGNPGDAGWTYTHDQVRKYLQKELPEVETVFLENVSKVLMLKEV